MNGKTVLLTGAGGAAIPGLIEHLRGYGCRVLACDCDPHAAGLYLADAGFVVPRGNDPKWLPEMRQLCEREHIDAIIPLVDEELLAASSLEYIDVLAICPRSEFVRICLDKWQCMEYLRLAGVTVPKTEWVSGPHDWAELNNLPVVLKPRRGHGSKGVQILRQGLSPFRTLGRPKDDLLQEYIAGIEYTVSVVCWRDNMVQAVVPKRIIDKRGHTRIATTEHNDVIDATCRQIAESLQPGGPFNVQGVLRDGQFYVFEINPRFSGTVNLTIGAGCDEVGGLLDMAFGGKPDGHFSPWRSGVTLLRHHQDLVAEAEWLQAHTPEIKI